MLPPRANRSCPMLHVFARQWRLSVSRWLKRRIFLLVACCWLLPLSAQPLPLAEGGESDELYPQSIVKPVQAHHRVQELAPELVVEAIRQVAG